MITLSVGCNNRSSITFYITWMRQDCKKSEYESYFRVTNTSRIVFAFQHLILIKFGKRLIRCVGWFVATVALHEIETWLLIQLGWLCITEQIGLGLTIDKVNCGVNNSARFKFFQLTNTHNDFFVIIEFWPNLVRLKLDQFICHYVSRPSLPKRIKEQSVGCWPMLNDEWSNCKI